MTPGSRYRSQACQTEVIVVQPADVTLFCGGHPMVGKGDPVDGSLEVSADAKSGTLIGKRYTDSAGELEVLVTRAGEGTLATASELLVIKQAKKLPSSD